jgi:hypothetical protein
MPIFAAECGSRAAPAVVSQVSVYADKHALSPAERAIVLSSVIAQPKEEFLVQRDIAVGTYKAQVRESREGDDGCATSSEQVVSASHGRGCAHRSSWSLLCASSCPTDTGLPGHRST